MLNDDVLTVIHDGNQEQVELEPHQAENLFEFLQNTEGAPRRRSLGIPDEQRESAKARIKQSEASAETFHSHLTKLAALDPNDLATVMALVDVIEFGDGRLHGGNWILAFTTHLMCNVRYVGAAAALEADPRSVLSELACDLSQFWAWMTDGTDLQKRHPGLFAPPPAAPARAAASEPTQPAAKGTAKGQRTRKPRKKVSRAA